MPGANGKPLPLGEDNGALGRTIGNLLNGKKTAPACFAPWPRRC